MMKRFLASAFVALFFVLAFTAPRGETQERPAQAKFLRVGRPAPGRYIVAFKDTTLASGVDSLVAEFERRFGGGRVSHVYRHTIKGFAARMTEREALAVSEDPRVAHVSEDGLVSLAAAQLPAMTQNSPPWGLDRIDQRFRPLDDRYRYSATGANVNVYILDNGIRTTHREFRGRTYLAASFVDDGTFVNGCGAHGTHVAGVIGGTTYGVAKSARLFDVRVIPHCGNEEISSSVMAGVEWVTANHLKPAVANMSLSAYGGNYMLDEAVRRSVAAGVTYVVAAGNIDADAGGTSPARVVEAITVAATDELDARATFPEINGRSNFGPAVDLFAPGSDIIAAGSGGDEELAEGSGTSMATPHAAGVAALYLQRNPLASPAAVHEAIVNDTTAGAVSDPGPGTPNRFLFTGLNPAPPAPLPVGQRVGRKVVRNADGRLELFSIGSGGCLQHIWQLTPNGNWSNWTPMCDNLNLVSEPIAILNADGRVEVFALAVHRGLAHRWQLSPGGAWSDWHSLDGPLYSNIAVAMNADGRLQVFAIGADGASLWTKYQLTPNSGWSGWISLGGSLASEPVVGINLDTRLEVFARMTNNTVAHVWQVTPNGGFSSWESLGGNVTAVPAVGISADGRQELFARGADGSLLHRYQWTPNGGWGPFESLGGYLTSNPVVASNADGRLDVFVRGSDYAIWHRYQLAPNGGWGAWSSLGGYSTSNPTVGMNADSRLELFTRAGDYSLQHAFQWSPNSGWSGWAPLGGYLTIF